MRRVGALIDPRARHPGRTAYRHLLALAQSNRLPAAPRRRGDRAGRPGVRRRRPGARLLARHGRSGSASRPRCSATPTSCCSTSRSTAWTPRASAGCANCCARWPTRARTVLVSSHLMSEMEDTADHLVVLGRGRLLADVPMEELLGAHSAVRVRTPQGPLLADALRRAGGHVELEIDGALRVEGLTSAEVGDAAFVADVRLHELSRVTASLEAAYLALTDDDVEYRAVTREPRRAVPGGAAQRVDEALVGPLDVVVHGRLPAGRRRAPGWLAAAGTDSAPRADVAVQTALTGFGVGQLVLVVLGVLVGDQRVRLRHGAGVADRRAAPQPAAAGEDARRPGVLPAAQRGARGGLRARRAHPDRRARRCRSPTTRRAADARAAGGRGGPGRRARGRARRGAAVDRRRGRVGAALVLVAPPALALVGSRLAARVSQSLPALRVGRGRLPRRRDAVAGGHGAWSPLGRCGVWMLGAVLLESPRWLTGRAADRVAALCSPPSPPPATSPRCVRVARCRGSWRPTTSAPTW